MASTPAVVPFVTRLGPYNVSVVPFPSLSRLILSVEHHRTKQFYRLEVVENQIPSLTQGLCQSCKQLFDLLCKIISFLPMDPNKYSLKLTENSDKVDMNITFVVFLEPTPRQYYMTFQLVSVHDSKRLETKMNDLTQQVTECFQCISELTLDDDKQRYERASRFDPATILRLVQTENVLLTDYRTVTVHAEHVSNSALAITSQPFHTPRNQRYVRISFVTNVAFLYQENTIPTILVGVFWRHNQDRMDITAPLEYKHAWWFSVHSGRILNVESGCRDYTWPAEEFDHVLEKPLPYRHRVDILLDTIKRRVAFRVDGKDTGAWAFHLPGNVQIDQLYPIIFLNGNGCSVTIDP